ncbi:MAG: FliI/YscN family ATPase [Planctomycetota bacterium]
MSGRGSDSLRGALGLVASAQPMRVAGRVASLRGLTVLVEALSVPVGSMVELAPSAAGSVYGEVVGFDGSRAVVMLFGSAGGIRAGDRVAAMSPFPSAPISPRLLGRVIDALGRPIDGGGAVGDLRPCRLDVLPVRAMQRGRIDRAIHTGIRAIDLMTTLGRGQRLGIFAGSGVGKSTLLGSIAQRSSAEVNVIALIGERGREVREFIEDSLGPEGAARSVLIVATGDEPPLMRIRAAWLACAVSELFRDMGRDVLLMMDSVTRFAHAQRQVGLSVGEPPATKGYTPSVFAQLPVLLERAGPAEGSGSVTGLYTVLVDGDDLDDPVADAARGILDGHVVLSRKLAERAHYPAIDVLASISRVADQVIEGPHKAARDHVKRLMGAYAEIEELVQIGAYARGSNPESDIAVAYHPRIMDLLRQGAGESAAFGEAQDRLLKLSMESGELLRRLSAGEPAEVPAA